LVMGGFFDTFLSAMYGITGISSLDGVIGTFLLGLLASVIGEFSISVVFRINRKHLDKLNADLKRYGDLSREALQVGDEVAYKALNRQANDAYGQVFFNRFGLSAASLWPAFFALDWMQHQFGTTGVRVPFFPAGVNYVIVFLICFIAARMLFGRLKRRLPYFKGQYAMLLAYGEKDETAGKLL